MASEAPVIGSRISLISKSEIRYEGILYAVDPKEATVALAKVKICGTEGRRAEIPVFPRYEICDYIIFRISDIKDLHICPDVKSFTGLPPDPAIVHSAPPSQYSSVNQPCATLSPFQQLTSQMNYSPMSQILTPGHYSGSSRLVTPVHKKNMTSDAGVQVSVDKMESIQSRESGEALRQRNRESQPNIPARRRVPPNRQPSRQGVLKRGGRRFSTPTITETFENDYDFELANAEFQELESKLAKVDNDSRGVLNAVDIGAYDREKSFFDDISCEATQRSKGLPRFDWRYERKLNVETFGAYANNAWMRRRRGRGSYRRGFRGRGATSRFGDGPVQKTVTFDETPAIKEVEMVTLADQPDSMPIIEVITDKENAADWPEPIKSEDIRN